MAVNFHSYFGNQKENYIIRFHLNPLYIVSLSNSSFVFGYYHILNYSPEVLYIDHQMQPRNHRSIRDRNHQSVRIHQSRGFWGGHDDEIIN